MIFLRALPAAAAPRRGAVTGRGLRLRRGEDGLSLHRHVLYTRRACID